MGLVLDAVTVIEEKSGRPITREIFDILCALPYVAKTIEKDIATNEGRPCCVDKTYYLLNELINKHQPKEKPRDE